MIFAEESIPSNSFLEYAFLKYVFGPTMRPSIIPLVHPQYQVSVSKNTYYIDYLLVGQHLRIAIELDGYAFHSDRLAFSYDRLRQNDLQGQGYSILRFSYDNIRTENARCIEQLQTVLRQDPSLQQHMEPNVVVPIPEMEPNPLYALQLSPRHSPLRTSIEADYFTKTRRRLNVNVLRSCQFEALQALTNYFASGQRGRRAACVMAVGSGKTVLGIAAIMAFTRRRAMIVTPGNVIRGTFDRALNERTFGNALHHLPSGPLIPGCRAPHVLVLDRQDGSIRNTSREQLLSAEIIVTNYHALGDNNEPGSLFSKLRPDDIDFLVIDEAHIAAANSYQRLFRHFPDARAVLMSACFRRMDGKPIEADIVYRYRLIDAISDGVAKNLMLHRHVADPRQTTYEVVYPNGIREEIVGKDALLKIIDDERKLSTITAKSLEPIRRVMAIVRQRLDAQRALLHPVKPRVLFAALGERHAAQIAEVAREFGIPCAHLHHSMGERRIKRLRTRFERDSGDLQGLVHLRMLGQGYDFPPITVVVPMRPYGSFAEFYQFIGRGIRVLSHPAFKERLSPPTQVLDIVFHSELGLEEHLEDLRTENEMEPWAMDTSIQSDMAISTNILGEGGNSPSSEPEIYVLTDKGAAESGILHTPQQIETRRQEREREALATAYARYVESSPNPISFEQYLELVKKMRHE